MGTIAKMEQVDFIINPAREFFTNSHRDWLWCDGIHWVLCKAYPHPHQQHHCWWHCCINNAGSFAGCKKDVRSHSRFLTVFGCAVEKSIHSLQQSVAQEVGHKQLLHPELPRLSLFSWSLVAQRSPVVRWGGILRTNGT